MSGIAGFIKYKSSYSASGNNIAPRMLNTMIGANNKITISSSEDTFKGIGALKTLVNDVSYFEGSEFTVAFHGHLTNRNELIDQEDLLDNDVPESNIIAHLYSRHGREINLVLKGTYCFALWDEKHAKMILSTDRFGYGCLYYYQDDKWCVFATEIKAILKVMDKKPDPNIDGICDIINYFTVYENDTPFKGIFLLPHGTIAQVTRQGMDLKRYWDYAMHPKFEKRGEKELNELTKEMMLNSVKSSFQNHDQIGVMISAGLDSRWIAGAAKRVFPEKKIILYHSNNGIENLNAIQTIASNLKLPLVLTDIKSVHTEKDFIYSTHLTDGHCAVYTHMDGILTLIKDYPNITLTTGYLLDELFYPWFYLPSKNSNTKELTLENCLNWSFSNDKISESIFYKNFSNTLIKRKHDRVLESLSSFNGASPVEQSHRFYCLNRGRRHVYFWMHAMGKYTKIAFPGIDYDFYDFVQTIPYQYRKSDVFYRNIICELFPEVASAAWSKTGQPLIQGNKTKNRFYRKYFSTMKFALQRVTRGVIDLRNPRLSFDRSFRQNKKFREVVCTFLTDNKAIDRGFYSRNGIEQLISQQLSGRDYGNLFQSLISVESLYRTFFD